jgi:hypothetical protein
MESFSASFVASLRWGFINAGHFLQHFNRRVYVTCLFHVLKLLIVLRYGYSRNLGLDVGRITVSSLCRQAQYNSRFLLFIVNTATCFGRKERPSSGKIQFSGKSIKAEASCSYITVRLCYKKIYVWDVQLCTLPETALWYSDRLPCAGNNAAPTGRIFTKFDIWVFFENMLRKFKFQ